MQKNKEKIRLYNALYILVVVIIGILCIVAAKIDPSDAEIEFNNSVTSEQENQANKIVVYVTGEVVNPGLYEVEHGTRVQQIIDTAGGATENADLESVNLAKVAKDGEQIKVPAFKKSNSSKSGSTQKAQKVETKVDINCGSVEEYVKINGVTPELAGNIVKHIATFGPFKKIEEMQFVEGMSPDVYGKILKYYQ